MDGSNWSKWIYNAWKRRDLQRGQVKWFLCSQFSIHSRWKTWLHLCNWLTKSSSVNSDKQTEQISSSDPPARCSSLNLQTRSSTSNGGDAIATVWHVLLDRTPNILAMAAFSWRRGIHTQVKKTMVAMHIEPLHNAKPIILPKEKTQDQQLLFLLCWFM